MDHIYNCEQILNSFGFNKILPYRFMRKSWSLEWNEEISCTPKFRKFTYHCPHKFGVHKIEFKNIKEIEIFLNLIKPYYSIHPRHFKKFFKNYVNEYHRR